MQPGLGLWNQIIHKKPEQNFDWTHTVYGDVHDIIPQDIPDPLGETVTTIKTEQEKEHKNQGACQALGIV